jgi:hypothetical protein
MDVREEYRSAAAPSGVLVVLSWPLSSAALN